MSKIASQLASHFSIQMDTFSDRGKVKPQNDDWVFGDSALGLAVICDGVGGLRGGKLAAQAATEELSRYLMETTHDLPTENFSALSCEKLLAEAIQSAAQKVFSLAQATPGMATTLSCLWLVGPWAIYGHIGNCRIYQIHQSQFYKLTQDHIAQHQGGVVLTRALGSKPVVSCDMASFEVMAGDQFLLCTDGVYSSGIALFSPEKPILSAPFLKSDTLKNELARIHTSDNLSFILLQLNQKKQTLQTHSTVEIKVAALKKLDLFKDLPFPDIAQILSIARGRFYDQGSTLMRENDAAKELVVVLSGGIEVLKKQQVVFTGDQGIFGEMALLTEGKRSATVRATKPTQVLLFHQDAFRNLLEKDSALAARILLKIVEALAKKMST